VFDRATAIEKVVGSREEVYNSVAIKTSGNLFKDDIVFNKECKYVEEETRPL
jgi:hypothetical protein